jgi:hypothetical protein
MDISMIIALMPTHDAVYLAALCGVAAALDAWLPLPKADSSWAPIRKIISVMGQNYRNATNINAFCRPSSK